MDLKSLTFVLMQCILCCIASHFRGGTLSWTPVTSSNESVHEVEIKYRVSWRRSALNHYCSDEDKSLRRIFRGEGTLKCFEGCTGNIAKMNYMCTDFSIDEDWTTGVNTIKYQSQFTQFVFGFIGGKWLESVADGNRMWVLLSSVNLLPRADTGEINSSPITSMAPVIRVLYGCNHTIRIPVEDPDGDVIRCRWAISSLLECGDACANPERMVLHPETCTLQWTEPREVGWYAVTIMIEDFSSTTSVQPLSKIPLQFLISVLLVNENTCGNEPVLIPPTPVDDSRIQFPPSGVAQFRLIARTSTIYTTIVNFATISPLGVTKSELSPVSNTTQEYYVEITWTPSNVTFDELFCFSAIDSVGLTSKEDCITLEAAKVEDVHLVDGKSSHEGRVEVYVKGKWGSICDDTWDLNDAHVVCRQLGFSKAVAAFSERAFGRGTGHGWLNEVSCFGNESNIADCPLGEFDQNSCEHKEDAGVVCFNENLEDGYNNLLDTLFSSYKSSFRPPFLISIELGLNILKIIDVSPRKQLATMDAWLAMKWTDHRLAVNQTMLDNFNVFDNVTHVSVPPGMLYTPDVRLFNGFERQHSPVNGKLDVKMGQVELIRPYRYEMYCNVSSWPSDNVTCSLKFGSWTHYYNEMNLQVASYGALDMQPENGICRIVDTKTRKERVEHKCAPGFMYDEITFDLNLKCYHNNPPVMSAW